MRLFTSIATPNNESSAIVRTATISTTIGLLHICFRPETFKKVYVACFYCFSIWSPARYLFLPVMC